MNTVRPSRPSFLRAARLVLLAALSAGTLGLSGCGGGVSVGVGIGIDAGSQADEERGEQQREKGVNLEARDQHHDHHDRDNQDNEKHWTLNHISLPAL